MHMHMHMHMSHAHDNMTTYDEDWLRSLATFFNINPLCKILMGRRVGGWLRLYSKVVFCSIPPYKSMSPAAHVHAHVHCMCMSNYAVMHMHMCVVVHHNM